MLRPTLKTRERCSPSGGGARKKLSRLMSHIGTRPDLRDPRSDPRERRDWSWRGPLPPPHTGTPCSGGTEWSPRPEGHMGTNKLVATLPERSPRSSQDTFFTASPWPDSSRRTWARQQGSRGIPSTFWQSVWARSPRALFLTMAVDRWGDSRSPAGGAKGGASFGFLVVLGFNLTFYGTTNISSLTATLVDPFVSMVPLGSQRYGDRHCAGEGRSLLIGQLPSTWRRGETLAPQPVLRSC